MGRFSDTFTDEEEELILSLYVTEPYADIFGVYDTLPSEQFATFGASYSRTHRPFQQSLIMAIEAGDILDPELVRTVLDTTTRQSKVYTALEDAPETDAVVAAAVRDLLHVPTFIETIHQFRGVPDKAKKFIQKWAQQYGHNSIKEMGNIRFCCENIPDISGKHITGHALAHPQVKSSRYIDWREILARAEDNIDVQQSKHAELLITTLQRLNKGYNDLTEQCELFMLETPLNLQYLDHALADLDEEGRAKKERLYKTDVGKTVFDATRYLLTPSMLTSLACSVDTRSMEDIITSFLSSPLHEDQRIGQELWDQTQKLVPVLLGEKCHAGRNEYEIARRERLDALVKELFPFEQSREYEITGRTNFVPLDSVDMFGDMQLAACLAYEHGHGSFIQYYNHLVTHPSEVKNIIDAAFEGRGQWDAVPKALQQGGSMREFLMDYGGYRDVFRHRPGSRSRQRLSTYHGFETPPLITASGLQEEYDELNRMADETFRAVAQDEPYTAQLIVPFAARCRTLYTWSSGQDAYFVELRSKPTGNESYRLIAHDIADENLERAPEVWKHVQVDRTMYPPELAKIARKWYDSERGEGSLIST